MADKNKILDDILTTMRKKKLRGLSATVTVSGSIGSLRIEVWFFFENLLSADVHLSTPVADWIICRMFRREKQSVPFYRSHKPILKLQLAKNERVLLNFKILDGGHAP